MLALRLTFGGGAMIMVIAKLLRHLRLLWLNIIISLKKIRRAEHGGRQLLGFCPRTDDK